MNKIIYIFFLSLTMVLNACEEENNLINLTPPKDNLDQLIFDSVYTPASLPAAQPKNVLIEDFTAVKCDNCPNAQKRTDIIVAANPADRVFVIGIHCTSLAIPDAGYPDFRTAHGDDIINYISNNQVTGLPTGDVNQKVFPPDTLPTTTYGSWGANTTSELALTSNVNLDIVSKTYDPNTKKFTMEVAATFQKSFTVPCYFSVALTETGIIGKQLTPTGPVDTFLFKHVLRKMMIPFNGLKIADAPQMGMTYLLKFSTVMDNKWVVDNCKIVAFVHQRQVSKKDVEQVIETTIK
jgi:hypothetical protein